MADPQEATGRAASSTAGQYAQEMLAIEEQSRLVDGAYKATYNQVLSDASTEWSNLWVKHCKEREVLAQQHNKELLDFQIIVQQKLDVIQGEADLSRLQLGNRVAALKTREKEAEKAALREEARRLFGTISLANLSSPTLRPTQGRHRASLGSAPSHARKKTNNKGPAKQPAREHSVESPNFDENIQRRVAETSVTGDKRGSDWLLNQPHDSSSASSSSPNSAVASQDLSRHGSNTCDFGFDTFVPPLYLTQSHLPTDPTQLRAAESHRFLQNFPRKENVVATNGFKSFAPQHGLSSTGAPAIPRPKNRTIARPASSAPSSNAVPVMMAGDQTEAANPNLELLFDLEKELGLAQEQPLISSKPRSNRTYSRYSTPGSAKSGSKRSRAEALSEEESEAAQSKQALASQPTLPGSDTESRKAPKSRREIQHGEKQSFVTKMISYHPSEASNGLDITWRDGTELRINYLKQIFEPYLGIEKRSWICRDMVLNESWAGRVFYHHDSARFEVYGKNGARLRIQFKSKDEIREFLLYYRPMFKDRVAGIAKSNILGSLADFCDEGAKSHPSML